MELNFDKKKVVVAGDLILDEYVEGRVRRISPEAPVPVVELLSEEHKPGGAANVAVLLRYLGANVSIAGVVGNDERGDLLLALLEKEGVDTSLVVREKDRPTTVKTRVISKAHHIVRLDREVTSLILKETEQKVINAIQQYAGEVDAVLVEDYDKGFITPTFIKELKKLKVPIYVDPKIKNMPYYTGVRLLKPNLGEFLDASGNRNIESDEELYERAFEFKMAQNVEILLVTMGERGMLMIDNGSVIKIPAIKREVYDVTGAGDMVISAFTLSELSGYSPLDAAIIASIAAGIEVTRLGATPVYPEEIKEVLAEEYHLLREKIECLSC